MSNAVTRAREIDTSWRRTWGTDGGHMGTPSIAIIGTGFGGLGMAIRLKQAGIESFTIYEKADGVGGTWRDNVYPGAACDVPSHLYSFSFERNPRWSRHYSPQPEILAYLEHCAEAYDLGPHLRFGTEITAARFDETTRQWTLETAGGDEVIVDIVVSGLGQLNRPALPAIPGRDSFAGTSFHSARWDHGHDLAGRRVAVIGNGASAVQFVPHVADAAAAVTIFQRSANWVVPKHDKEYHPFTQRVFAAFPSVDRTLRTLIYLSLEARFLAFLQGSKAAAMAEKQAMTYLHESFADPDLRAALTPDYPISCKRILISNDYYPALAREHVSVVTDHIEQIVPEGIVTADGTVHEVDTIIYGTGFQATSFLSPLRITGTGGLDLGDVWHDGAEAYLGMTVTGFPNLFMLYGPNTNLGHNSIVFMIERQVDYVVACVRKMQAEGWATLNVRRPVMDAYNRDLQAKVGRTAWGAGCDSWYKTAAGKVTNNWPNFTMRYWLATKRPRFAAYVTTTAGPGPGGWAGQPPQSSGLVDAGAVNALGSSDPTLSAGVD